MTSSADSVAPQGSSAASVRWLYPWLLAAAGAVVYLNSFSGVFLFDDHGNIEENRLLQHPDSAWRQVLSFHRPLTTLTLAANYALGGLDVRGYHAVNLAIHLLAGLVLYDLVRRTLLRPPLEAPFERAAPELALAAALIWLVHPLQTESITYVVHRAEALAGLFYLLTLECLILAATGGRERACSLLAVLCCGLGMASKETAVTAPVLALLFDRAFLADSWREAVRRRWGLYLGLAATWALLLGPLADEFLSSFRSGGEAASSGGTPAVAADAPAAAASGGASPDIEADAPSAGFGMRDLTPLAYLRSQPGVLLHYLRLALWPDALCVDYQWPVAQGTAEIVPAALVVLALLLATAWAWFRWRPLGFVGAWFFLILAPTSSVLPIADLAAERRTYLPLAAVVVVVVLGGFAALHRFVRERPEWASRLGMGAVVVMVVALGVLTYDRNQDYESELTMWQDVVHKRPENVRGYNNLGRALADRGYLEQAERCHRMALHLNPLQRLAYNNLGRIYLARRQLDEAARCFAQEAEINPRNPAVLNNLGSVLGMQGKREEAIRTFNRALQLSADDPQTHYNLGLTLMLEGKTSEAIPHLEAAARLKPEDHRCLDCLGRALLAQGRVAEAIACCEKAVALKPDAAAYRLDLRRARESSRSGARAPGT